MKFLNKNKIPFAIRLKENMQIRLEDGSSRQFRTLLRKRRRGAWAGWLSGMQASPANRLRFAAKRIKDGELLVVATNLDDGGRDLNRYRKRWGNRMSVRGRQDPWPQYRGHPHHGYASWQKGGVENTNGWIRRWLPRPTDLDERSDHNIQDIAMTLNSTPRKCLAFKTPIEAMLAELGKNVQIRLHETVAPRGGIRRFGKRRLTNSEPTNCGTLKRYERPGSFGS